MYGEGSRLRGLASGQRQGAHPVYRSESRLWEIAGFCLRAKTGCSPCVRVGQQVAGEVTVEAGPAGTALLRRLQVVLRRLLEEKMDIGERDGR